MSECAPPDSRFVVAPTARFAVLSIANGTPAGAPKGAGGKKQAAAPAQSKPKAASKGKEAAAAGGGCCALCTCVWRSVPGRGRQGGGGCLATVRWCAWQMCSVYTCGGLCVYACVLAVFVHLHVLSWHGTWFIRLCNGGRAGVPCYLGHIP